MDRQVTETAIQGSLTFVHLEPGPLSLVSAIEELRRRNRRGSGLENREYDNRDPPR
jgi:hypothetical protein